MRNIELLGDALLVLAGATLAHICHAYFLSVPLAFLGIVLFGRLLKEELGL